MTSNDEKGKTISTSSTTIYARYSSNDFNTEEDHIQGTNNEIKNKYEKKIKLDKNSKNNKSIYYLSTSEEDEKRNRLLKLNNDLKKLR